VVLWALQAGTRDFYPAMPALVGPVRNIFSSPYGVCLWLSYIPSQELRIWPQVERDVLGTDLTMLYLHTVLDQGKVRAQFTPIKNQLAMRSFCVSTDSDADYLQQWHYITGETILSCLAVSGIRGQVLGSAVGSMTFPSLKAVGHMAYPRLGSMFESSLGGLQVV
jgi:hypothetical protein